MQTWAAILPLTEAATLGAYRLSPFEACAADGLLWVRGPGEIPRAVPWQEVFEVRDGGALYREGQLLGAGRLPAGTWQKLATLIGIERPTLQREGLAPVRAMLQIVPDPELHPVVLLGTSAECWTAFATQAPEIRLRPLRFAQTETGRVFIEGRPLPSIRGEYFTMSERLAVPAGQRWEPALTPASLRAGLALEKDETAIFFADTTWLRIPARAWQPATRAAVRLLAATSRDEY